jgi:hypothetical protein
MEDDLNKFKVEYLSNLCIDHEDNWEEISSVALLSPACFSLFCID